eukprot:1755720-Rhodomonas_salina.1
MCGAEIAPPLPFPLSLPPSFHSLPLPWCYQARPAWRRCMTDTCFRKSDVSDFGSVRALDRGGKREGKAGRERERERARRVKGGARGSHRQASTGSVVTQGGRASFREIGSDLRGSGAAVVRSQFSGEKLTDYMLSTLEAKQ